MQNKRNYNKRKEWSTSLNRSFSRSQRLGTNDRIHYVIAFSFSNLSIPTLNKKPTSWRILEFLVSLHIRESRFRNPAYFCCGIRNTPQGIRNPSYDWNPESKFHQKMVGNPVPGIRHRWCGIQYPKLSWISLHEAIQLNDVIVQFSYLQASVFYQLTKHQNFCAACINNKMKEGRMRTRG